MSEETTGASATPKRPPSRLSRLLRQASSFASLGALVLGTWIKLDQSEIKARQAELDERIKREHLTQEFADKVFAHLSDLAIQDRAQREGIIIDLLDLITEANTSVDGQQPGAMIGRQRALPLRMALITGNDDVLADMGGATERYQVWLRFAQQSANAKVRVTALRALEHLCRAEGAQPTSGATGATPPLLTYLADVRRLSDDLQSESPPIRAAGLQSLRTILSVMARDPLRYRADPSFDSLAKSLTSVVSISTTASDVEEEPSLGAGRPANTSVQLATECLKLLVDSGLVHDAAALAQAPSPVHPDAGPTTARPPEVASRLDRLIDDLDTSRSDARASAASQLFGFSLPVVLTSPKRAGILLGALGDPDPAVRKYVAEVMMRIHDPKTVDLVWTPMAEVFKQPTNGNGLYNAVVVCGTWARTLPSELDDRREKMRTSLRTLRGKVGNDPAFRRTARLIDELVPAAALVASRR
jgi:hypothetical protein